MDFQLSHNRASVPIHDSVSRPIEVYRPAEIPSIGAPGVRFVLAHHLRSLERRFSFAVVVDMTEANEEAKSLIGHRRRC